MVQLKVSCLPPIPGQYKSIIIFGDQHLPYQHKDGLAFLTKIKEIYQPTWAINLGDEITSSAWSFHDKDPEMPYTAGQELQKAIKQMRPYYELFPFCDVLDSNHGSMTMRKAKVGGIPMKFIKSNKEVLEAPLGWDWHSKLEITLPTGNKCIFMHHLKANILNASKELGCSFVAGHTHSVQAVHFWGDQKNPYFAMTPGCLIDDQSLEFAYNKLNPKVARLGCGMIINGIPMIIPMLLDEENRWLGKKDT